MPSSSWPQWSTRRSTANGLNGTTMSTGWCRTRPTGASSTAWPSKLQLPPERVVVTVDRHANTSAASIPLALAEAVGDGRIKRGHLVLLEAHGRRLHLGFRPGPLVTAVLTS